MSTPPSAGIKSAVPSARLGHVVLAEHSVLLCFGNTRSRLAPHRCRPVSSSQRAYMLCDLHPMPHPVKEWSRWEGTVPKGMHNMPPPFIIPLPPERMLESPFAHAGKRRNGWTLAADSSRACTLSSLLFDIFKNRMRTMPCILQFTSSVGPVYRLAPKVGGVGGEESSCLSLELWVLDLVASSSIRFRHFKYPGTGTEA